MLFRTLSIFLVTFLCASHLSAKPKRTTITEEKPIQFAIVIPSYNNERWVVKNLESVFCQTYPHWHLYYVNDCSKDRTWDITVNTVRSSGFSHKCTLINNPVRKGCPLANHYAVINSLAPTDVVVCLDGDDQLLDSKVLEYLASVYTNPNVWVTYGSFVSSDRRYKNICRPFPEQVMQKRSFRSYEWVSSHLKTFYAKLFQNIRKEDLLWNGKFYTMSGDLAFMFCVLEQAAKGHIRFIQKPLYYYNINNPLNEFRVNKELTLKLNKHIRNRPPYSPLKTLF